jgi:hypothetical protein
MRLEVDITALDQLPETDPIGSNYAKLSGVECEGEGGLVGVAVTCGLLLALQTCLVSGLELLNDD